ncbi:MAG: (2Fe-2S) ferredoxin domain-containing protein [Bdellovibrionales bacterium]|nr:(2Fe-2S) ferredoxin domain-containing protein [Bdellovibrionales bacterium]
MKTEKTSWSDLAIYICTKCGKDISKESLAQDGEPAENLKLFLKSNLMSRGLKTKIRVMTSSCLGTCPTGEQAVAFISAQDPNNQKIWICHPEKDKEFLLEEALKHKEPK